jgi:hypothetical protein
MLKQKKLALGLVLSLAISTAFAAPITGSVDSDPGDGLIASRPWDRGNAEIEWRVTLLPNNLWKYEWEVEVEDRDIAYSIFQVGAGFTTANVLPGTTSGWSLGTFGTTSNAGLPRPITGIRFPGSGEEDRLVLFTDFAPGGGDVYIRGESHRGSSPYAFHDAFGSTTASVTGHHEQDRYVFVPVGAPTHVSEPKQLVLLGLGVLMLSSMSNIGGKRRTKGVTL